jgi:hypothetical protein
MMQVIKCLTIVVENPFIKQGPRLQSFAKITAGVSLMMGAYLKSIVIFLDQVWYLVKLMPILRHNH